MSRIKNWSEESLGLLTSCAHLEGGSRLASLGDKDGVFNHCSDHYTTDASGIISNPRRPIVKGLCGEASRMCAQVFEI